MKEMSDHDICQSVGWLGLYGDLHRVGPYHIVEYSPWKREGCRIVKGDPDLTKKQYAVFVNRKNVSESYDSLDHALLGCIAHKNGDSRAAYYAVRVLEGQ